MSLDYSSEQFSALLNKATTLLSDHYQRVQTLDGFHSIDQHEVASWFDEPLPREGSDPLALLDLVKQRIIDTATGNFGPNMYAYVMAGGNQVSTIADLLASTINQNGAKWHLSPSMTEIEKRVVKWTAEMIGFTPEAGGVMVSGGSAATLTGLTVARNIFLREQQVAKSGLFGLKPLIVYCSNETHNSTDKSIALLGIGTDNLRRIPAHADFTLDLNALEQQIQRDRELELIPFCVIGNAGTVNTGAIDDLQGIARIAKQNHLWFHVDGAYGGLACSLSSLREQYRGIELADSIALDFHKWLYQPYEVGITLVRSWDTLRETYFKRADYLDSAPTNGNTRFEFNEHYFQLSRNSKAFKVWLSLKAYGFTQFQAMIQKDIDLTRYLEQSIRASTDFELHSQSALAIACFRYTGQTNDAEHIAQLNQQLVPALEADGRVFITGTRLNGLFVLRACVINHRKTTASIDYLLHVIREVASSLR